MCSTCSAHRHLVVVVVCHFLLCCCSSSGYAPTDAATFPCAKRVVVAVAVFVLLLLQPASLLHAFVQQPASISVIYAESAPKSRSCCRRKKKEEDREGGTRGPEENGAISVQTSNIQTFQQLHGRARLDPKKSAGWVPPPPQS